MTYFRHSRVGGALKYNEIKSSKIYRLKTFSDIHYQLRRVSHFNPEGIALTAFYP